MKQFFRNRIVVGVTCILAALLFFFGVGPMVLNHISQQVWVTRVAKEIPANTQIKENMLETVKIGGYTITARTSDGGYTATCQVSVPCILTVSAGSGGTVSGGGIYAYGITATLTATPNSEWYFVNWSDGSTVQTRTITVTSDFTLTANFHLAPVTWTAVNGSSNTYNLVGATPTASVQIGTAGVNYGYGTVTYTFSEPLTLKATNGIEVNTNISSNSTTELCARSDYGYFYFGDGSHSTVSDVYYSYSQFSSSNPFGGTSNAISEIEVGAVGEGNGTKPNACGTITVTLYPEEGNPIVLTSAGISYR